MRGDEGLIRGYVVVAVAKEHPLVSPNNFPKHSKRAL